MGYPPRVYAAVAMAVLAAGPTLTACAASHQAAGRPLHAPANYDPAIPGWIACSRLIVEGDVVSAHPVFPDRMVTELRVNDWVKPASGPKLTKIETADIVGHGATERWQAGTHLFLRVDVDASAIPDWEFSRRAATRIKEAVPESHGLQCPYGPS